MIQVEARHHRINRATISVLLLFLSWPICLVHTFWNNSKPCAGHWFITEVRKTNGKLFTQDIQYYIYDTGNMLSTLFIILSLVIVKQKTRSYRLTLSAILTVALLDIFNYWLCYKQSTTIIIAEAVLMLLTALTIAYFQWKKN